MSGVVSQDDVLGRYGGEEFVVGCRSSAPERALEAAERLRVAIGQTVIDVEAVRLRITASFGIALCPAPGIA